MLMRKSLGFLFSAALVLWTPDAAIFAQTGDFPGTLTINTTATFTDPGVPSSSNNSFSVTLLDTTPTAGGFQSCTISGVPADGGVSVGNCQWTEFVDGGFNLLLFTFNWQDAGDVGTAAVWGQFCLLNEFGAGAWVRFFTSDGTPASVVGSASGSLTYTEVAIPGAGLSDLLGIWRFVYTIISTFTDTYDLQRIVVGSTGIPGIIGIDLADGGPVIVARVEDIIDDPFPFVFFLLDPDLISCDFFAFDQTGPNTVEGIQVLILGSDCGSILGGQHPMTGTRIAAAMVTEGQAATAVTREVLKLEEVVETTEDLIAPSISDEMIQKLMEALQSQ